MQSLIIGLDIGGANTKAALINGVNEEIIESYSTIIHFPFWRKSVSEIAVMLKGIVTNLLEEAGYSLADVKYIAVSITAELSDAFKTKREGIIIILESLLKVFTKKKLKFISTDANYISYDQAKSSVLKIAAANWVATALFLGHFIPECILLDAGSTTIDVIPIEFSIPVAKGNDDLSRIINHELIYTGGLRATIPSITHFVPYRENLVRISFEKFALVSDVHRILGNISEQEYINDTADNRSKSLDNCYARLARIICSDIESTSRNELDRIAQYIYEKQLKIIISEIEQFMKNFSKDNRTLDSEPFFVVTGLSKDFLAKEALRIMGYKNVKDFRDIVQVPSEVSSSSYAVAGALHFELLNENFG